MLPCFLKLSVSETNTLIFLSEIGKYLTLSYISIIYPSKLSAEIPVGSLLSQSTSAFMV